MKYYFVTHIAAIDAAVQEAISKYNKAVSELERAQTKNNRAALSGTVDQKTLANLQMKEAATIFKGSVAEIREELSAKIKEQRAALLRHNAEFVAANPDDVDEKTVSLIDSGALAGSDLVALANRFADSPTMLKMLAAAAGKEKLWFDSPVARVVKDKIEAFLKEDTRLGVFEVAADTAMRTIREDVGISKKFQQHWDNEFCQRFKERMASAERFVMEDK